MFAPEFYYSVCGVMVVLAVIVFAALFRITAGYGVAYNPKWGPTVNNRAGWILMEAPVIAAMLLIWLLSPRRSETVPVVMASLFLFHYAQRSFIFPLLIRGRGRMPLSVIAMGVTFNVINAYLIGGWIFHVAPPGYLPGMEGGAEPYPAEWFHSPLFIIGLIIFLAGMAINLHSDHIIRNLRRPGDTAHHIPRGGVFRFVTSANYFGEILEWTGFAILTWSPGGAIFALWTFANLAPRARSLHKRYLAEFGNEYARLNRRYVIPFIF